MKKNLRIVMAVIIAMVLSVGLNSCHKDDIIIPARNVKNGETIELTANVTGTNDGKPVLYTVVYYCDDKEIGSSNDNTNNYLFKYVVKDLSLGQHTLNYRASYEDDNINLHSSATIMTINVIE